jgi:tRNA threonylcarbamoyladenosine biosynthesis protein TsaE
MNTFTIKGLAQVPEAAAAVLAAVGESRVLTFEGEIGAGKTTLIKALCLQLGVSDEVSSPTFALVNEYQGAEGQPVYHADLYRLKAVEEALDIGISHYLDSGHWCFIEWPELIEPLLPEGYCRIKLEFVDDSTRKIIIL